MSRLVILTEAGKNIGFGHYTRCAALRDYLLQNDISVRMLVFCNEIKISDSNIVNCDWLDGIQTLTGMESNTIVLVDSYLANDSLYSQLRSQVKTVVAIDDYNRITYDVDLVINPNVFFDTMNYSNQEATCIGGKDYVLLREAFRMSPVKKTNKTYRNILVTLGGTDYRNLLVHFVELAAEFPALHWTIIDAEHKLSNTVLENNVFKSTVGATEMATLMHRADVVVSACGQTLHELVAVQTPTIGICIDHDQLLNQQYYIKSGFLQYKNMWDDSCLIAKLISQIADLSDYKLRQSITEGCAKILNKNGVANFALNLMKNHD